MKKIKDFFTKIVDDWTDWTDDKIMFFVHAGIIVLALATIGLTIFLIWSI